MSDISLTNQPSKWRLRWIITKNEIWNILRHPNYLVSMGTPIFMALVFGLMIGTLQESEDFVVVVYDQGESAWLPQLQKLPEVDWQIVNSETAVLEATSADATGGIIIPANFDTAVAKGNSPELTVYVNQDASRDHIIKLRQGLTNQVWEIAYDTPPATITWQETNTQTGAFANFSIETYTAVLFVILSITMTGLTILPQIMSEERNNGVFSMLMASPVELNDLLIGQSLATLLFTLLIAILLLLITAGSAINWGIALLMMIGLAITLNGIGLLLGLNATTKAQCNTYTAVASIFLIIPVWFLIVAYDELPTFLAWILQLIPTYHFGNMFIHALNNTVSIEAIGYNLAALLFFTILYYALIYWHTKRPLPTH